MLDTGFIWENDESIYKFWEVFMVRTESLRISGWTSFASTMMLVYAGLLIVAGLAGIFNGDLQFRSGQELLIFNTVAWGWIHLTMGVVFAITGIGLIRKQDWAFLGAALLVCIAILLHLLILAVYPGWAALFLIFDSLLLYALMVPGSKGKL